MTKRSIQSEVPQSLLRPAEAAKIAGLTPTQLARLANRGELTVSRPSGTHRRYLRAEVEQLIKPAGRSTR